MLCEFCIDDGELSKSVLMLCCLVGEVTQSCIFFSQEKNPFFVLFIEVVHFIELSNVFSQIIVFYL